MRGWGMEPVGKGAVQGVGLAWGPRAFYDLELRRTTLLSLV